MEQLITFLMNTGYFEEGYTQSDTNLIVQSNFTGERFMIDMRGQDMYTIYLYDSNLFGKERRKHLMTVKGMHSVMGVVTDEEDRYLREEVKKKKKGKQQCL